MGDGRSSSSSVSEHGSAPRRSYTAPPKDASPTRQQRRLQGRNARFSAKKLSISGLSNKLTHLIQAGEPVDSPATDFNKENRAPNDKRIRPTIRNRAATRSLGILEELSNSATTKNPLSHVQPPIYQDHPACFSPQEASFTFPSHNFGVHDDVASSPPFDISQDTVSRGHLRKVDQTARSVSVELSHSAANVGTQRPAHLNSHFDADKYIEHIERELQHAKDEAYSPLTRRPLKQKLRTATKENERLQQELALLKETFETEVKKTVEHKTAVEVELRRKVRDLEEVLEDKNILIQHLQDEHEERRLDSNTIDVLRSTIDRLEIDKQNLENVNLSMSKRNEVLTQLLAMSPTKTLQSSELRSPVREKRSGRPMSLVLPRLLSSPKHVSSATTASQAASPRGFNDGDISPFKLSPTALPAKEADLCSTGHTEASSRNSSVPSSPANDAYIRHNRQGISDVSTSTTALPAAGAEDTRTQIKRKPRRFVAGSTQLKPLLLPALTGENGQIMLDSADSSSCFSSPRRLSDVSIVPLLNPVVPLVPFTTTDEATTPQDQTAQPLFEPGPAITDDKTDCFQPEFSDRADARSSIGADSPQSTQQRPRTAYSRITSLREQVAYHTAEVSALFETPSDKDSSPFDNTFTETTAFDLPMPLFSPGSDSAVPTYVHQRGDDSPIASPLVSLASRKRRRVSGAPGQPFRMLPSPLHINPAPRLSTAPASPSGCNVASIRRTNNFVGLMTPDRRDVRTLTTVSISTVFSIITNCVKEYRKFRRDPYALARRIIANAWHLNWKLLGRLSWWVLGLFIPPRTVRRARAPIDWDQYDGESIADRYCKTVDKLDNHNVRQCLPQQAEDSEAEPVTPSEPASWTKSIVLWGKFSFAMILAVGGAVVKGPGEMLKDVHPIEVRRNGSPPRLSSVSAGNGIPRGPLCNSSHTSINSSKESRPHHNAFASPSFRSLSASSFDFRSSLQINALEKHGVGQYSDGDITLRPIKRPRARVEALFQSIPGEDTSRRAQSLHITHDLPDDISFYDNTPEWPNTNLAFDSTFSHTHFEPDQNITSSSSSEEAANVASPDSFA